MGKHKVELSRTAEKQFRSLEAPDRRRIVRALTALSDDPHPPGSRKLSGYVDVFRVRVGLLRVLYSVDGERLIVIILKIGHRKGVYR
jgi:mRNA interferase RelE/StbE